MVQEKKTAISLQLRWNNDQPENNRKENEKVKGSKSEGIKG